MRLVLSWLLVAVLAVDLIASPLHGHRHDGEWSIGGALSASAEHRNELHSPDKVHAATPADHDAPEFSHSISALRGQVQAMADVPSSDEAAATPFWSVTAQRPLSVAAAAIWPPDRHRAGSSAFRSLPPNGRAPPLHA